MKAVLFILALVLAFQQGRAQDDGPAMWWNEVTEPLSCVVRAEEGDATLRVGLTLPTEDQLQEVKDANGYVAGYSLNGKALPERFWPGCTLLTSFELEWEGRKIDVPERYWTDLAGFRIQESALKVDELSDSMRYDGELFLAGLEKPRLYISADKGTLLIEWIRPEEGDGRSTIRWIISKSGSVMRHRHTPPRED
ncbi:MAG: hypothetical protein ACFCU3_07445 [Verrucomicrobiales bacterium]